MQRALGLLKALPPDAEINFLPREAAPTQLQVWAARPGESWSPVEASPTLLLSADGNLRPSQGKGAWMTLHNKFKSGTGPAGPACLAESSPSLCPHPAKGSSPVEEGSCRAGQEAAIQP